jgi:C_GCAxxG_C_C family probable redox protein
MEKTEDALKTFREGFNCAQSVLTAFSEDFNIPAELSYRISCGFGAGMGRLQETCGAVTGALMVIGLVNGSFKKGQEDKKEKTYSLVRKFARNFIERNKTISCRELLNCDLSTDEGDKIFRKLNLREKICSKAVRDAVEILEDILK